MKTQAGWMVAVFAAMALPAEADIVAKTVQSSNGSVSTGYVLQGSHKMRGLGKRRISVTAVPSVRVISSTGLSSTTQAVIPALQNHQLKPKPRFGYGSDYSQGGKGGQGAPQTYVPPAAPVVNPAPAVSAPVLQAQPIFTYSYRPREYYPAWGWGGWYGYGRSYGYPCRSSFRLSYFRSPFAFSIGW